MNLLLPILGLGAHISSLLETVLKALDCRFRVKVPAAVHHTAPPRFLFQSTFHSSPFVFFLVGFFLSDWRQHDEHLNLRPTRRALHPLLDRSNRQRCSEYLLDFRPVAYGRHVKLSIRRNGSISLYSCRKLLLF